MNRIIKLLLPELHWRQPVFNYSTCVPFTKHPGRIKKFRETGNLNHICKNNYDKDCFAHDAAYSDSKYLAKSTISDMILKDRTDLIPRNPKYDGYQKGLASMVYNFFFDKETASGATVYEKLA